MATEHLAHTKSGVESATRRRVACRSDGSEHDNNHKASKQAGVFHSYFSLSPDWEVCSAHINSPRLDDC
jgi:hypothetical protein